MKTPRPTISLVIADTDSYGLGLRALQESCAQCRFDRVLVFSDKPEAWPGYGVVRIPTIRSLDDYSNIILTQVVEHLETDFFLVVQFDGFVLNGDEFSPHYFHYDYIGAPWPAEDRLIVGNGGFSWRSRRLAEAVATIANSEEDGKRIEDAFICLKNRAELEASFGCRFAPPELAVHFSVEYGERDFPTFGFHGFHYLPLVYKNIPDFLVDNLTPRMLRSTAHCEVLASGLKQFAPAILARFEERRAECLSREK